MLCPKCKIEAMNRTNENGDWVAVCRNPKCPNYNKQVAIVIQKRDTNSENK